MGNTGAVRGRGEICPTCLEALLEEETILSSSTFFLQMIESSLLLSSKIWTNQAFRKERSCFVDEEELSPGEVDEPAFMARGNSGELA